MAEINDTFMSAGQEYKIVFKNVNKDRISIIPIGDSIKMPVTKEQMIIGTEYYKVTYIRSDKRITLELIKKGD